MWQSKFNGESLLELVVLRLNGVSQDEAAEHFGVAKSTISKMEDRSAFEEARDLIMTAAANEIGRQLGKNVMIRLDDKMKGGSTFDENEKESD